MIRNNEYFNTSLPAGYDGLFDWDYLIPAFEGTRIQPMDIDGLVERNGRFLVFETKDPGSTIPKGQQITLRQLHRLGCFTIFYIEGKKPEEISKFFTMWPKDEKPHSIDLTFSEPYTVVVNHTKEWFNDANNRGNKTKK